MTSSRKATRSRKNVDKLHHATNDQDHVLIMFRASRPQGNAPVDNIADHTLPASECVSPTSIPRDNHNDPENNSSNIGDLKPSCSMLSQSTSKPDSDTCPVCSEQGENGEYTNWFLRKWKRVDRSNLDVVL
jgi:hypothetical protein